VTLTADLYNRRVHGNPVADFTESLADMLDEGGGKQLAMVRFTVVSSVGLRLFPPGSLHGARCCAIARACGIVA
jgi:hypothetical protein